jgi:hypothetical protein
MTITVQNKDWKYVQVSASKYRVSKAITLCCNCLFVAWGARENISTVRDFERMLLSLFGVKRLSCYTIDIIITNTMIKHLVFFGSCFLRMPNVVDSLRNNHQKMSFGSAPTPSLIQFHAQRRLSFRHQWLFRTVMRLLIISSCNQCSKSSVCGDSRIVNGLFAY